MCRDRALRQARNRAERTSEWGSYQHASAVHTSIVQHTEAEAGEHARNRFMASLRHEALHCAVRFGVEAVMWEKQQAEADLVRPFCLCRLYWH